MFSSTPQTILQEQPYATTLNREVDLMRSLFAETNRSFDQKVCRSLSMISDKPTVISYKLISFIFYYPAGVDYYAGSSTEIDQPDELVFTKGGILRRGTTNEISANCVRLLDAHRSSVGAELDM